MHNPLAIMGSGMVSGVGLTAPASCAAIRCGLDNIQETDFQDAGGAWIVGSQVPLEQPWRGTKKLSKMLASALQECMGENGSLSLDNIPVIVCLAESDRAGRHSNLEDRLFQDIQEELGVRLHPKSGALALGRVGLVTAMQRASELIYQEHFSRVLIAGVDSLLVGATLGFFEKQDRLLTEQNTNGFIPGEAAAAIAVGPAPQDDIPRLLCLGVGTGTEEATENSGKVLRADGLVTAVKGALSEAGCDMDALDFRIADLSGGQYSFKEAGLAMTRLLKTPRKAFDIWHPADCIGEVGAAVGIVLLVVCSAACTKGYALGNKMLCHLANEDGRRAALVLAYQSGGDLHGE